MTGASGDINRAKDSRPGGIGHCCRHGAHVGNGSAAFGREWAQGRGGRCSARNLGGAQNGSGLGQMTGVAGGILRARGTADGSDGTGGIGRTEGLGTGSGGGLTAGNGGTGPGGMGGVGSSGAQVGIGGQEAEADGSGLSGVMGRGGSTAGDGGTGSGGTGGVGSSRAQGRSGGSGGTGGDTGTEGAGDSGAQAGIGAGAADTGSGDGTNGAGRGRAVGTISSGTGRSREGVGGAGCISRAWMASGASITAAADSRGGNGAQGITAGGSNEACRGTDMGASSYCGYKPHIVALNSSQLDGSARASLAAAKVSSDISSA